MIEVLETLLGAPVALEELKYKPRRRRTLRARGSRRSAIVKLYQSDRAPVVAARVAALAEGPPEPVVPRVLHLDPDRRMLVLSDVRGTPFREAVVAGDTVACRRVGAALAAWHHAWRNTERDALHAHTPADEKRILLAQAADAPVAIAALARASLAALDGDWQCTTVVHRDLYEEQILLDERIGLIDLDDAALGPPELDIGNLLAHIDLLELRTGGTFAPAVEALLAGYGMDSLDAALVDRCRGLTLLRLACIHEEHRLLDRAGVMSEVVPA